MQTSGSKKRVEEKKPQVVPPISMDSMGYTPPRVVEIDDVEPSVCECNNYV